MVTAVAEQSAVGNVKTGGFHARKKLDEYTGHLDNPGQFHAGCRGNHENEQNFHAARR
jgi:hypothetical protein